MRESNERNCDVHICERTCTNEEEHVNYIVLIRKVILFMNDALIHRYIM